MISVVGKNEAECGDTDKDNEWLEQTLEWRKLLPLRRAGGREKSKRHTPYALARAEWLQKTTGVEVRQVEAVGPNHRRGVYNLV